MTKPIKKIIDKAIKNKAITESAIKKIAVDVKRKKIAIVTGGNESTPVWTAKHDAIVKQYEEEKEHKEFVIIPKDEDWFPATKNMPKKPIPSDGDAKWCKTCNANTFYSDHCLVCTPFTEEQMFRYAGNLKYLRVKYPQYVTC